MVRKDVNVLSTKINQLRTRLDILTEAKNELENEVANIDLKQLKDIYETANTFIPNLHLKFSEMLSFHNTMLGKKINFITNDIPKIERELNEYNIRLNDLIKIEADLSGKLKKSNVIEDLQTLVSRLNIKYEQKGKYEEKSRQWESVTEKIATIDKELEEINLGIATQDKIIEKRIALFNTFFSNISEILYGEQFILSHDKNERAYDLKISTIGGNLGTGKKKGQIAAFDIAYIMFCEQNDIPCLHFILHDQIENIHDNQITLVKDIVSETNIQFIVPVLRDKLPPDINPDLYKVISLSQNNKLFKL